jgi:hypothetical protein
MMSRTWLDEIVLQHSELESPKSFWYWGALVSISAVVKDNIWIDRHIHHLYPNIYVMLHADSGLKKGPPISMAKRLVQRVGNTRVISGRSSIQGILKDMGTGRTLPGGKIIADSSAFICSSELSSSIVEDKVATTILTDLYDRQYNIGEWRSLLKQETFELKNPTVSMFTATNEAHSADFFARKDVQGGYFARTFIIHEHTPNRNNSLLLPLDNPPNYEASADYLQILSQLKGPFLSLASKTETSDHTKFFESEDGYTKGWFTPAGYRYESWYHEFRKAAANQYHKDDTGTLNRFGDSVLKVAMLISLARSPNLVITDEAMEEAISQCDKLISAVRVTTLGSKGLSEQASLKGKIIMELMSRIPHTISKRMLMEKMMMHYGETTQIDDIMVGFEMMGLLRTTVMGNETCYEVTSRAAKQWEHYLEGKI